MEKQLSKEIRSTVTNEGYMEISIIETPIPKPKDNEVSSFSNKVYNQINDKSEVLFDDKNDNAGVKFSRMDLIGLPHQIIIGSKAVSDGLVEYKNRKSGETEFINLNKLGKFLKEMNV